MFFRRSKRSIEDDPDERRHREQAGLARRGVELARRNNRLQISAIAVALTSLLVAILLALPSPADRTVPRAQVALASSFVDGVIPSSISWLGSPPRYAGGEVDDHCEL